MKHSRVIRIAVCLILAAQIIAGCVTSKTTQVPSVTAPPTLVSLNGTPSDVPAITITFSKNDKCSIEGASTVTSPFTFKWVVSSQNHDQYALAIVSMKQGKTLADLQAWPSTDPPDWLNVGMDFRADPASQQIVKAYSGLDYIYFVCFYREPETKFGAVGPVQVIKAP